MRKVYLQFGSAATVSPGPFQTVEVEARETTRPRSGQTVSGYGRRVPTSLEVKWEGRWRRVYAAVHGNSPSLYIGKPGAWLATVTD